MKATATEQAMQHRHFTVGSTPRWRIASTVAGLVLLIAGAMWPGLGGLLLIMVALIPMVAAAANVSLLTGVREMIASTRDVHWPQSSTRRDSIR